MPATSENVTVEFRPRENDEEHFVLHHPELERSQSLHEAFTPIFHEVADALRFEVAAAEPLPVVIPPVRRSWNADESELNDDRIARAGDSIEVQWDAEGEWSAEWRSRREQGTVVIGHVARGANADYDTDTFVRPDEQPRIAVDDISVTYTPSPSPSLIVAGRVHFVACPVPVQRPIRVHTHTDEDAPLRQGRFQAMLPVPPTEPESVDVTLSVAGCRTPVTSATSTHRIPTSLVDAQISVDEIEFAERLFARAVPKRIRFRSSGYAPRIVAIEFRPTMGEAGPRTVHARKIAATATHVEYYLDLDKEGELSFSESVPGAMLVTVLGQDEHVIPHSTIDLVPRLVRAVWEQLDAETQLRITSGELNAAAITAFGSVFDVRTPPPITPVNDGGNRFRDPAPRMVTNVLLAGGLRIPLDDRSFVPAFPENAAMYWKPRLKLKTAAGATFRVGQGDPEWTRLWDQVLAAREGEAVVLRLPGGVQALVALYNNVTFKDRITDAHSRIAAEKPFGVFFRGFCLKARLERLRPSLGKGGLLLKLLSPVHVDDRTRPPVSAFLPMRVLRSVDGDALAFWEPPAEPTVVPIRETLPVHNGIGYIYQADEESFWSDLPDVSPSVRLKYVTFNGLVFSLRDVETDFEGWWLPDGQGTFKSSQPFHDYSFDFTEGISSPYEFEVKDGVRCTVESRWLTKQGFDDLLAVIAAAGEMKSGRPPRTEAGGCTIDLLWRQRDADGTVVVTVTRVVDSSEVELYALA